MPESIPVFSGLERLEELKREFARKQDEFAGISAELKRLEEDLEHVRLCYDAGPGLVYSRLDEIDFELSRCRRIRKLLKRGLSFKQACLEWDTSHPGKTPHETKQHRQQENTLPLDEDIQPALKALWRELVSRFHPDLAACPDEKQRRTEIMKSLNSAYSKKDIGWLESFSSECRVVEYSFDNMQELAERITRLDSAIDGERGRMKELKDGVWFEWMCEIKEAKDQGRDLLADLERNLSLELNDKIRQLDNLKKDFPDEDCP